MNFKIVAKRKKAIAILRVNCKGLYYNSKDISYVPELNSYVQLAKITDVSINAKGGGEIAQLEASRLALAKYIVRIKPHLKDQLEDILRSILTSDGRQRESKKAEGRGARRPRQKSYR